MKRFHVHLSVNDLNRSINFYNQLFGCPPRVARPDYAKWMLPDPPLNFSVTTRHGNSGINHLGLEVDSIEALSALRQRMAQARQPVADQTSVTCCYANSDKAWTRDPDGVSWEGFFTAGPAEDYGDDLEPSLSATTASQTPCCEPAARD